MSNENEKRGWSFRTVVQEHPLPTIAGAVAATIVLCLLVTQHWYGATLDLKDTMIASLEQKKEECEKSVESLQATLKTLRSDLKNYRAQLSHYEERQDVLPCTVLCHKDAIPILDGEVIIVLTRISLLTEWRTPEDEAVFEIKDRPTGKKYYLQTRMEYSCDFEHKEKGYVLYFLGFDKKGEKNCARISVGKKR